MKAVCGINFFVFAFIVLFLVLLYTEQFRMEGFEYAGVMTQLASTRSPTEYFDSTGALTQLAADSVPSVAPSPLMVNHLVNQKIYDNLTEQGIDRMTMEPTGYKHTNFAPMSF
jgi:hypothetical protein